MATNDTVGVNHSDNLIPYLTAGIVGSVGFLGNCIVCVVFVRERSFRKQTNFLIVNQAAIDLMASFFLMAITFSTPYINIPTTGLYGDLVCKLWIQRFPLWSSFAASTFNLVALSSERYCAVVNPLNYGTLFSRRRLRVAALLAWMCGPIVQMFFPIFLHVNAHGSCTIRPFPSQALQRLVGAATFLIEFGFPVAFMIFAFSRIILVFGRQVKRIGPENQLNVPQRHPNQNTPKPANLAIKRNLTMTSCMVFFVYVICWSPNQFTFLQFNFGGHVNFHGAFYHFTIILAYCNSCANPFIYAFKYRLFQKALRSMILGNPSVPATEIITVAPVASRGGSNQDK